MTPEVPLILASASVSRARLLTAAGIPHESMAANVDEDSVKEAMLAEGAAPAHIAETLAEMKAMRVSARLDPPGSLVLGADQVLVADGNLYSKPENREEAEIQLRALRARTHDLVTAAVVARNGEAIWRHVARARLTMRAFSDHFITHYLDLLGPGVTRSVGCYEIEGLGAQLFSRIEGDTYTIQGLPLLPLMVFLRSHRILME